MRKLTIIALNLLLAATAMASPTPTTIELEEITFNRQEAISSGVIRITDIAPLAIGSYSNPDTASGTASIYSRGRWNTGEIMTTAPFMSVIDGVTVSIKILGGTADDLRNLQVYICRNEGTNCREFSGGSGTVKTTAWDGSSTWAGDTEISPGWEVWVGIPRDPIAPIPMSPITVDATVTMGWFE